MLVQAGAEDVLQPAHHFMPVGVAAPTEDVVDVTGFVADGVEAVFALGAPIVGEADEENLRLGVEGGGGG